MIYLDNSATSKYKPKAVLNSMYYELQNSANFSRSSHNDAINLALKIENIRQEIKTTLNAQDYHELVFTSSCTDGLNQVILGLLLNESNAHVITTIYEHNAVLRPLYYLSELGKINITFIKPNKFNQISSIDIENEIKPNTKLIVTTHMSNVLGSIISIENIALIAKKYNIPYLVDTAQSLGHLPLNMKNIDYISAAAHKGLHGPQGVGFIIVNKNIKLEHIHFGGSSIGSLEKLQPDDFPDGYEVGTLNSPGIIGLYEGFKFTYNNFSKINYKINSLANSLYAGISKIKNFTIFSEYKSPIISISHNKYPPNDISKYLNDNNIATRAGLHCAPMLHKYLNTEKDGLTRLSIGFNNSEQDIEKTIDVLSRLDRI